MRKTTDMKRFFEDLRRRCMHSVTCLRRTLFGMRTWMRNEQFQIALVVRCRSTVTPTDHASHGTAVGGMLPNAAPACARLSVTGHICLVRDLVPFMGN